MKRLFLEKKIINKVLTRVVFKIIQPTLLIKNKEIRK